VVLVAGKAMTKLLSAAEAPMKIVVNFMFAV
jgi:hypothetical protein